MKYEIITYLDLEIEIEQVRSCMSGIGKGEWPGGVFVTHCNILPNSKEMLNITCMDRH